MRGTAPATDRLAALALCRTLDLAAPAALAVDEAAPETSPAAEEAPAAADVSGLSAFDSSQAALLGRSPKPVLMRRDGRRAGLAVPMRPPWVVPRLVDDLPYPPAWVLFEPAMSHSS
jgi:hypothetical protein